MSEENLKFFEELKSMIHEIEDFIEDSGMSDKVMSMVVISMVTDHSEVDTTLSSICSFLIEGRREIDIMTECAKQMYDQITPGREFGFDYEDISPN